MQKSSLTSHIDQGKEDFQIYVSRWNKDLLSNVDDVLLDKMFTPSALVAATTAAAWKTKNQLFLHNNAI